MHTASFKLVVNGFYYVLIETLIKRSSILNINDMQEYCIRKKSYLNLI